MKSYLITQGVQEPVSHARWESLIITPIKLNGAVRICADYKCTINKALQQHTYPAPVVNQLLLSLTGGKIFAKLDLAQAYLQLPVTNEIAETWVRGAFRVKRLQLGISVAPSIFHSLMVSSHISMAFQVSFYISMAFSSQELTPMNSQPTSNQSCRSSRRLA